MHLPRLSRWEKINHQRDDPKKRRTITNSWRVVITQPVFRPTPDIHWYMGDKSTRVAVGYTVSFARHSSFMVKRGRCVNSAAEATEIT